MNNYGDLPIYEVADVTRRNILIQKVVQTCFKKLNIGAGETIFKNFLTETLSDASNSPLMIHFWTTEKAIIAVKAYCEV
jgi:L-ribulose-5-phosphate 3-epimerase UlaE